MPLVKTQTDRESRHNSRNYDVGSAKAPNHEEARSTEESCRIHQKNRRRRQSCHLSSDNDDDEASSYRLLYVEPLSDLERPPTLLRLSLVHQQTAVRQVMFTTLPRGTSSTQPSSVIRRFVHACNTISHCAFLTTECRLFSINKDDITEAAEDEQPTTQLIYNNWSQRSFCLTTSVIT